jgi:hypothetical protein
MAGKRWRAASVTISGVTRGYITTVDSLLLRAAEKVTHYVDGALSSKSGSVVINFAKSRTSEREAHA